MYLHKVILFDQKKEQATTKMKLENIMLNEIRHKRTNTMIPTYVRYLEVEN